ncbi:Alpha-L-fucoside fucohydrolase [Operophtera brumata]|uniref:Putative alpha-L-fucosidase n=1 Tax=Operophtera brumata TaxID=104452 RepID=A0A0L7LJS9_OPEBR|nr:Alpha-L-fucoside fucohydrolase [Operophtera brumata]
MRLFFLLLFLIFATKATFRSKNGRSYNYQLNDKVSKRYHPEWSDLDTRPLPQWYDVAKVGIFIHWGVYSVPGFGSEWFLKYLKSGSKPHTSFMKKNYAPGFTYQEFAPMFTAEYIVLTSKHHDGFTLFPSKKSFSWNSVDTGPKRDVVGELAFAVRKHGLKFGVYHSLYEWFNPMYLDDKKHKFSSFVDTKVWPELKQLIQDYKPSVIWSDGDWEAYDTYWKSQEFLAWLYNDSPIRDEVVVNDRWGIGVHGKHGDFFNFADRFNNKRLLSLGEWLSINGEAIYGSSPWIAQNDTLDGNVWYTCTKEQYNAVNPTAKPLSSDDVTAIYAIALKWPSDGILRIKGSKTHTSFMKKNYAPGFTYQEFAPMFTAEFFDADRWAKLFAKSGAKYIVLTSKHHDGFTLFPSKKSFSWNSVDTGPKRDVVGELAFAVRKHGLKFGVYHSLFEWFNPIYLEDKKHNFSSTKTFIDTKVWPDLKQLIHDYEPSVIWSDGDWEAYDTYWKSQEFLAWLYNDSPIKDEVVVNDRWGIGVAGKHGDFFNFADRFNNRTLQNHKWENAFTVDSESWGYRRNMDLSDLLTSSQLIEQLVTTVSCGGNVLINIGPTKEGTICPIFQERLLSLGKWLSINGEAIYGSSPWIVQNDTLDGNVWYTCTKEQYNAINPTAKPLSSDDVTAIYAIALKWPTDGILRISNITSYLHTGNYNVELLGNKGYIVVS